MLKRLNSFKTVENTRFSLDPPRCSYPGFEHLKASERSIKRWQTWLPSNAVKLCFTTNDTAGLRCLSVNLDLIWFNPHNPERFHKVGKETRTNGGLGNIIHCSCHVFFFLCAVWPHKQITHICVCFIFPALKRQYDSVHLLWATKTFMHLSQALLFNSIMQEITVSVILTRTDLIWLT